MMEIAETPAGRAQDRHARLFQSVNRRFSKTIDVRHGTFLADPDATIDTEAGVLREVRVELGTDDADLLVSMNDSLLRTGRISDQAARKQASQGGRGRTGEAAARRFKGHGEHCTQRQVE
jgi:hypothetical protein